jgi:DNA-binding transcriptional ArsR family regulator
LNESTHIFNSIVSPSTFFVAAAGCFTNPPIEICVFPSLDMQPFGCIYSSSVHEVFKALADPSRRKLLDELHKTNGQTLSELCEHLDMTRQAVTKHLALLEAASLVVTIWRGREKLHYLNPVPIHQICDRWINKFERHRPRFRAIRQRAR